MTHEAIHQAVTFFSGLSFIVGFHLLDSHIDHPDRTWLRRWGRHFGSAGSMILLAGVALTAFEWATGGAA
jgi:hypothetical protein